MELDHVLVDLQTFHQFSHKFHLKMKFQSSTYHQLTNSPVYVRACVNSGAVLTSGRPNETANEDIARPQF